MSSRNIELANARPVPALPRLIFATRWLQLPLYLESHPDQPERLSHVNASVLKVKLATAIIGISSIHLLKTFINAQAYSEKVLIAQTAIHITFLFSAMAIAMTDRLMFQTDQAAKQVDGRARND